MAENVKVQLEISGHAYLPQADADAVRAKAAELVALCASYSMPLSVGVQNVPTPDEGGPAVAGATKPTRSP